MSERTKPAHDRGLRDHRLSDRGAPSPLRATRAHREIMDWRSARVCRRLLPLLAEEMDLDGVDPRPAGAAGLDKRAMRWSSIGCGESGILAGIRLRQDHIPSPSSEKKAGPGGTWWENSYPGARVDVANHFYCYSFEPSNEWTHFFAEQPELQS